MSIQTYYLCRCKLLQHRAFISPHFKAYRYLDVEALPYHSKAPRSSYRQKSSRSLPLSDLYAARTFRVHLDTCNLGGLEVGRHLSRLSLTTRFLGAVVPCIRFGCRVIRPSDSICGRSALSGTAIKSPLYMICIVRPLYCGRARRPNQSTYYDRFGAGCQV